MASWMSAIASVSRAALSFAIPPTTLPVAGTNFTARSAGSFALFSPMFGRSPARHTHIEFQGRSGLPTVAAAQPCLAPVSGYVTFVEPPCCAINRHVHPFDLQRSPSSAARVDAVSARSRTRLPASEFLMLLYKSDFGVLMESPIAIVFLLLTVVIVARAARRA